MPDTASPVLGDLSGLPVFEHPHEEAATIAMQLDAPLSTVCDVLDAPRSTIYARRARGDNVIPLRRPGPVGAIDDE